MIIQKRFDEEGRKRRIQRSVLKIGERKFNVILMAWLWIQRSVLKIRERNFNGMVIVGQSKK